MLKRFWTFAHQATAAIAAFAADRAHTVLAAELRPLPMQPAPLSIEDRWERTTSAVSAGIATFARIEGLHDTALTQIDAADYTLQHLLEELSTAMPILPADGSALRALLATVGDRAVVVEEATLAA